MAKVTKTLSFLPWKTSRLQNPGFCNKPPGFPREPGNCARVPSSRAEPVPAAFLLCLSSLREGPEPPAPQREKAVQLGLTWMLRWPKRWLGLWPAARRAPRSAMLTGVRPCRAGWERSPPPLIGRDAFPLFPPEGKFGLFEGLGCFFHRIPESQHGRG